MAGAIFMLVIAVVLIAVIATACVGDSARSGPQRDEYGLIPDDPEDD
jgi:hypothetical protein